jgi:putative ABC transport system permease protein
MRFNLIKLFLNEFRKRKKKTALITFAIAWGALSLLLMMSFGRGLSNQFRIGFHGLGIDLILFNGGRTSRDYQGLPKGRLISLYAEDMELIRQQIPGIKRICAESYVNVTITSNGKETNRMVHGITAPFQFMRNMYAQEGGRFINTDDLKLSSALLLPLSG